MKITKIEIASRILLILLSIGFAYTSTDYNKQIVNTIGLSISFIVSIHLHKHFYPLFIAAIGCWLLASSQELYSQSYAYLSATKNLWVLGNILFPLGVLDFLYRLIFKYKIVENEDSQP